MLFSSVAQFGSGFLLGDWARAPHEPRVQLSTVHKKMSDDDFTLVLLCLVWFRAWILAGYFLALEVDICTSSSSDLNSDAPLHYNTYTIIMLFFFSDVPHYI